MAKENLVSARRNHHPVRLMATLLLISITAAGVTYVMYRYTQQGIRSRMLESMASVASKVEQQVIGAELHSIRDRKTVTPEQYKRISAAMQSIQGSSDSINSMYILPHSGNGMDGLMSETLSESTDTAPLFSKPREREPEWKMTLAAYSPVLSNQAVAMAIVDSELVIQDFIASMQQTLVQFLLFMLVLILLLIILAILVVRFYGDRVSAMHEIDRQKDELLGIVSHQLATPVASIMWYLEMLEDGDLGELSDQQKEHVGIMQGVTESLKDLISMILDVSVIQLGRMHQEPKELNLSEFFLEIVHVAKLKAKKAGVILLADIPTTFPIAYLDKRLTRMVLSNLLSNAVKYTDEGGEVHFSVKVVDDNASLLCEVRDTGCGIPKIDQEAVFEKLYRASNVRNKIGGNGFGLFVAKAATEAQKGSLTFESQEGEGTTFWIKLPIEKNIED